MTTRPATTPTSLVADPSLTSYRTTGDAGRYGSTAGSQAPVDASQLNEHSAAVERDGFVILRDLIDAETLAAMRSDIDQLLSERPGGRNRFEGFKTQRLYAVIDRTLACNPLVEHPLVLGLLDRILEPNYLLSQLQATAREPIDRLRINPVFLPLNSR